MEKAGKLNKLDPAQAVKCGEIRHNQRRGGRLLYAFEKCEIWPVFEAKKRAFIR